ncbi:MAG: hypothetical protein AAF125_25710 [Chloroflexota bacterium]
MDNYTRATQAGRLAIIFGSFQILYGLLAVFFPYSSETTYGWDEVLWIVSTVGMACAAIGILALGAGKPSWLAWVGGIAVILGVLIRIVASVFVLMRLSWDPITLILSSILLLLGGMLILGIALLRGDKVRGWRAWTPVIVTISGFIVAALFSVNLYIHHILLGLWGFSWMLVGYVAVSYVHGSRSTTAV